MKIAIVRSSDLGDRWDAQFHTLKKKLGPRADELAQDPSKTSESITKGILALPSSVWQYLSPLSRSNAERLDRAATLRIVEEYPHLSLALIEAYRHEIDAAAKLKIAKANEEIQILDQMIDQGEHHHSRPRG